MSVKPSREIDLGDVATLSANRISLFARAALTIGAIVLTILLAEPFLASLTWALVLAVVFVRPHRAIEAAVRQPSAAAALSVAIVALIVVAPLLYISSRLIAEAVAGANYIQQQISNGQWREFMTAHPWLQSLNSLIEQQFDLQAEFGRAASWLTNASATFIRQSTGQVVTILLAFYLLFFFLRDRKAALDFLNRLSPFSVHETQLLAMRAGDTIYATIYGTIVVAGLQGFLGGVAFWWLGFPSPVLWGLVMGVLSIVPVLGSFVVWVPATIFLAIEARWGAAIALASWGSVIIGSSDNLVRPLLMGNSLRLHTAPTFIAMVGGLELFGPSGIVLGPIVMTTTALLVEFWRNQKDVQST